MGHLCRGNNIFLTEGQQSGKCVNALISSHNPDALNTTMSFIGHDYDGAKTTKHNKTVYMSSSISFRFSCSIHQTWVSGLFSVFVRRWVSGKSPLCAMASHEVMPSIVCNQWPLLVTWFSFNPSMDNIHMPSKVWDGTTYPFLYFNGCTVEVWEWRSDFIPYNIRGVITYPCWD